ncbi:glutamine-dependent NAD(+) synthetase with GAT domain-containing protein [Melanomma pulvis-pyrius CBS 109.77]|uniref:Glutamine-dependent NAD(+) synthetase n=1 Tax=Melanomma pulvis-pyrius CBS 109.77 TaxID=1314802 RepID=A0A6A6XWP4_9PLEO|nr:glutamine-dependent NAD(+) synthetase with GAT domain-containing protein [Melanomma pulvis-pyrius CBS 109.77]
MGRLMTVATCSLNQWVLDWEGNLARIVESIRIAKERGATLRVGPELEITGYGCLDHFLEGDTYLHAWEMLKRILENKDCYGLILDIGMPVMHRGTRFNCRVLCLDGKIILIRPKLYLANDGNYRENRFFIGWGRPQHVEQYYLPRMIAKLQGNQKVPIGDAVISTFDTCVGAETCEELFTPNSPHTNMSLNGVEIVTNSSGSHHNLRKLDVRISLIQEATRKNGGIYLYSNQQGCDGDRLYYDGCALIVVNGDIVAQGSQFSCNDVEVVTAVVDIEAVRSYRFAPSRGIQAIHAPTYERIEVKFSLSSDGDDFDLNLKPTGTQKLKIHQPEEEISLSAACWMWDYLRRSQQAGFLIPLSGGIDSCATATLVFSMCRIVVDALKDNAQVRADVQRIAGRGEEGWLPKTPADLCSRILHCVYMGMKTQSSFETRSRAKRLAEATGAYFLEADIDEGFKSIKNFLPTATGFDPRFRAHGGTNTENLALQNIQARTRMVTAYYFAQMLPLVRGFAGSLLVLGSANVDECLRGYLTKYDCSSADINPIGGVSKTDLIKFIVWAKTEFSLPILDEFVTAIPTAELEPITEDYVQSDEADMGFTYVELSILGRLRKEEKAGPYASFTKLVHVWGEEKTPREIADKVKRFFHYWAVNRHKMTTMTPGLHLETYSPDDNRFDLRPFCYPAFYKSWSFKKIDELVEKLERAERESGDGAKVGA